MARKKKKGDDIKTDGWMDTFADTMTLLLTFFILLYSISAVDSEKLKELSQALQNSLTGDSSVKELQSIDDLKLDIEEGTKYEDLAAKLNEIGEQMATKQTRLTAFGRKVRKRLIDKNMTQVELAALLGCNKQYIHKILVGERSGKKYIEAISRILDIEVAA